MKTSLQPHTAANDLNHLRRGHTYRLITTAGRALHGEYLGIEVIYGDWCLLLRGTDQTFSVPSDLVERVEISLQAA